MKSFLLPTFILDKLIIFDLKIKLNKSGNRQIYFTKGIINSKSLEIHYW